MSWSIIIILIIIGLAALLLEFIAIPGGIVGVLGGMCIIGSIIITYSEYGVTAGHITIVSTLVALILMTIFFLRSKSWKKMTLDTTIDSKVNEDANIVSVGMEGICITKLSLTGNAKFGDNIVEVTSERGYINENTSIIITKIEGNKIIVKPNN